MSAFYFMDPLGPSSLATMIHFPIVAKEKLSKKSILVNSDSPPVVPKLVVPQVGDFPSIIKHGDFTNLNLVDVIEPTVLYYIECT